MIKQKLTFTIISIFTFLLTACGGSNNWVTDADLKTYEQNQDFYGELTTYINTRKLQLPSMQLPIVHPKNTSNKLGTLTITPSITNPSETEVAIAINITKVAKLSPLVPPILPNGADLPVGTHNSQQMIALVVPGTQIKVYSLINTQTKKAIIGVAIPIKQFDSMGEKVGNANIFPAFQLENGINGNFGIFTGDDPGESGFAFFINASQLMESMPLTNPLNATTQSFSKLNAKKSQKQSILKFKEGKSTQNQEKNIYRAINRLNKRKSKLSIY